MDNEFDLFSPIKTTPPAEQGNVDAFELEKGKELFRAFGDDGKGIIGNIKLIKLPTTKLTDLHAFQVFQMYFLDQGLEGKARKRIGTNCLWDGDQT